MMPLRSKLMLVLMAMACGFLSMGSLHDLNDSEPLIPKMPAGLIGEKSFFCRLPNGTLFYADLANKIIRVQYPNEEIWEYDSDHLYKSDVRRKAISDDSVRRKWFAREPVLWNLTNMKRYEKGVVLFHRGGGAGRVVQFIDKNLKVRFSWEDKTLRGPAQLPEAAAVTDKGVVIARGEVGEILRYDLKGNVTERFTIRGLFNESRVLKPEPVSEEFEKIYPAETVERLKRINLSDAMIATRRVAERDKILPKPRFLIGTVMPSSIEALEVTKDEHILIMDDTSLYVLQPDSAALKAFNINGLILEGEERFSAMRIHGEYLFLTTTTRALSIALEPRPRVLGKKLLPLRFTGKAAAWDAIPPKNKDEETDIGTFLFCNRRTRQIEEIK